MGSYRNGKTFIVYYRTLFGFRLKKTKVFFSFLNKKSLLSSWLRKNGVTQLDPHFCGCFPSPVPRTGCDDLQVCAPILMANFSRPAWRVNQICPRSSLALGVDWAPQLLELCLCSSQVLAIQFPKLRIHRLPMCDDVVDNVMADQQWSL
jgi:hypothetical protein